MQIQGWGHLSPFSGDSVITTGVVTVVSRNGFFVEDPVGDDDPATSDGLFAFTGSAPAVDVGDWVRLEGVVTEYRPANDRDNLTITEITRPHIDTISKGHSIPAPTLLGCNGRMAPSETLDDDGFRDFDPGSDGIDFYESLESMRVRIPDAVAVSTANRFGEVWALADGGACATGTNTRGGITISQGDMNPERVQIDDTLLPVPLSVTVGDRIGDVTGVVSYRYGSFEILPEWVPVPAHSGNPPEVVPPARDDGRLNVASFNVRNLGLDQPLRIADLAEVVATNLGAPDIIALQEIQDDSGSIDDGIVHAHLTYAAMIGAIRSAGGPGYDFREVTPEDGQDGGEPGGNIRVGFLFRPDRVSFVDRGIATASSGTSLVETNEGPRLSLSPGRIDPLHEAWRSSRKPLAAEFDFAGRTLFVIACHFSSRTGSTPLFGATQPPRIAGEAQRAAQARVVQAFVEQILAADPWAPVIVLGDFNDFQFSETMATLARSVTNLTDVLAPSERYTYNFEGNSQALDHVLVSPALADGARYDVVHASAEFPDGPSDHDPVLARLVFSPEPSVPKALATPVASPNPFRTTTRISYLASRPGPVEVAVYDVTGRRVRGLEKRQASSGPHVVQWDGLDDHRRALPSGVYFVRVLTSRRLQTTNVVLIR
jgi:endonuclease/exonuclease/phosphatase family metal-dependent hydrolase